MPSWGKKIQGCPKKELRGKKRKKAKNKERKEDSIFSLYNQTFPIT